MNKQELREDGREDTGSRYADLEIWKKENKSRLIDVLSRDPIPTVSIHMEYDTKEK